MHFKMHILSKYFTLESWCFSNRMVESWNCLSEHS